MPGTTRFSGGNIQLTDFSTATRKDGQVFLGLTGDPAEVVTKPPKA